MPDDREIASQLLPREMAKGTPEEIEAAARAFLTATEALCDWLADSDASWDHWEQRPEEHERLCTTMVRMQAVLGFSQMIPVEAIEER